MKPQSKEVVLSHTRWIILSVTLLIVGCENLHSQVQSSAQVTTLQQSAAISSVAYDVATVKPSSASGDSYSININGDTYAATNVTLPMLLHDAFNIKEKLIVGMPKELIYKRFDLTAKIVDSRPEEVHKLTIDARREMLQRVLVNRFMLHFHRETKDLAVYNLLRPNKSNSIERDAHIAVVDPAAPFFQGVSLGSESIGDRRFVAHGVPLSSLVDDLSHRLDRSVIDKTGLDGKYDISLNWESDVEPGRPSEDSLSELFPAVERELGLKLVTGTGPVDVFVIDSASTPTDN